MVAGTDFTETNGATCVVPSHLWDDPSKPNPAKLLRQLCTLEVSYLLEAKRYTEVALILVESRAE